MNKFKTARRYVTLGMKVIITFFLMGLISYNTQFKEDKSSNNAAWNILLGNILQIWAPSLARDDDDSDKLT